MWRVKLLTARGEYVTHVLLPPFVRMPEVIIWGQRFFQLRDGHCYWEVVAAMGWTEQELDEQGRGPIDAAAIRDFVG